MGPDDILCNLFGLRAHPSLFAFPVFPLFHLPPTMRRANTLRRFYVNVFRAHVLSVLASPSTNAEKRQTATVRTKDAAGFQQPPA